jgi:hypothetical protein
MKLQILEICIATVAFSPICSAEEKQQERADWAHFFKEASAEGTIAREATGLGPEIGHFSGKSQKLGRILVRWCNHSERREKQYEFRDASSASLAV